MSLRPIFLTLNRLNLYQSNGGKNEYSIMCSLVVMSSFIIYMHTAVVYSIYRQCTAVYSSRVQA